MKHLACTLFSFSMPSLMSSIPQGHAEPGPHPPLEMPQAFLVHPPSHALTTHMPESLEALSSSWSQRLCLEPLTLLHLGHINHLSSTVPPTGRLPGPSPNTPHPSPVAMPLVALCLLQGKLQEHEGQCCCVTCEALAPGLGFSREEIHLRILGIPDWNCESAPR